MIGNRANLQDVAETLPFGLTLQPKQHVTKLPKDPGAGEHLTHEYKPEQQGPDENDDDNDADDADDNESNFQMAGMRTNVSSHARPLVFGPSLQWVSHCETGQVTKSSRASSGPSTPSEPASSRDMAHVHSRSPTPASSSASSSHGGLLSQLLRARAGQDEDEDQDASLSQTHSQTETEAEAEAVTASRGSTTSRRRRPSGAGEQSASAESVDTWGVDAVDALPAAARTEHAAVERVLLSPDAPIDAPAAPADAATAEPSTSSSTSRPRPATESRVVGSGFRRPLGIYNVEVAPQGKGPTAKCFFCNAAIPRSTARFQYQYVVNKVPRWIHPECCARMPAAAREVSLNFLRSSATTGRVACDHRLNTAVNTAISLIPDPPE